MHSVRFKYCLRAVSVHIGRPESGHFITYRRGIGNEGENAWYRTSDAEVGWSLKKCFYSITTLCTIGLLNIQ